MYYPDGWALIRKNDDFFVFGSWSGGYLSGDSWRRNSGITRVTQNETNYFFYGASGSCYCCPKEYSHISAYNLNVLQDMIDINNAEVVDVSELIEFMGIEEESNDDV